MLMSSFKKKTLYWFSLLLACCVFSALFSAPIRAETQTIMDPQVLPQGMEVISASSSPNVNRNGWKIQIHHWTGIEPHWGVWMNGRWATPGSAYFTGSSGAYVGYNNNGWVGTYREIMLIDKSWLHTPSCWFPGLGFQFCPDRKTPSYHWANMTQI